MAQKFDWTQELQEDYTAAVAEKNQYKQEKTERIQHDYEALSPFIKRYFSKLHAENRTTSSFTLRVTFFSLKGYYDDRLNGNKYTEFPFKEEALFRIVREIKASGNPNLSAHIKTDGATAENPYTSVVTITMKYH